MLKSTLAALALTIAATTASAAATVCRSDEQQGCFSFQIVGVEHQQPLMQYIKRLGPAGEARELGMHVYEGMRAGRYHASPEQSYVLYLWMDATWRGRPLPEERIVQTCFTGLRSGQYVAYKPRGLSAGQLSGGIPTINGSRYGNLGAAHTALLASCDGGVGAGWVIPKDVMKHVLFAMICPVGGSVNYPFTNRDTSRQGIVHSTDEIRWYLGSNWDFAISAAVWN